MNYEEIIAVQHSQILAMQSSYDSLKQKYELDVANLTHQLEQLKRLIYGKKSERFIPDTSQILNLFSILQSNEEAALEADQIKPAEKIKVDYERNKTNQKGRKLLSNCGHLESETQIVDVDHSEGSIKIGELTTEKLGYRPGKLIVLKTIRPKYKDQQTGEIKVAPMPSEALPKCEADVSLLAQIVVSKFVDHLPEHRQQQMFKRLGVVIPPSTMNDWTHQVASLMKLVALQLRKEILDSQYVQIDESTIKVMFVKKDKTHQGYMWVVNDPKTKNAYFEYQEGRGRAGPKLLLKDYKGKIQSDGYNVYEHIDALYESIDHFCCMSHARRKFDEALTNDKTRASQALVFFQELYKIEDDCRTEGISANDRQLKREYKALPVLQDLRIWMDKQALHVTPQSPIAKAIRYSVERWDKLTKYVNHGEVEIDNNLVENAIRPLALGRKNYLFAGGHEAATNIGHFYTVFSTCKAHEVNPYDYTVWFLNKVANTKITNMHMLTPFAFKN